MKTYLPLGIPCIWVCQTISVVTEQRKIGNCCLLRSSTKFQIWFIISHHYRGWQKIVSKWVNHMQAMQSIQCADNCYYFSNNHPCYVKVSALKKKIEQENSSIQGHNNLLQQFQRIPFNVWTVSMQMMFVIIAAIYVKQTWALFFRLKYTCTTFWGNFCDESKFLVP